jgi:cytochrome b6-f complex iron-sulfur subunit
MPFRTGRFFLIRLDDGGLMAISMICSHLGCTVNWDASEDIFKCPCHSSSFDRLGNVIKSPASKALNYHKVIVRDGMIMVDMENLMVKQKFEPGVVTYA